jgi:hypothetical protein
MVEIELDCGPTNVRFGSKAEVKTLRFDICFTQKRTPSRLTYCNYRIAVHSTSGKLHFTVHSVNADGQSAEEAMIKVSVMYPNTPGARFNHEYYRDRHMPLVKARMGDSCKYYTVDKGLAGGAPGTPATYVYRPDSGHSDQRSRRGQVAFISLPIGRTKGGQ